MSYLHHLHYCCACGEYLGPDNADGICCGCQEGSERQRVILEEMATERLLAEEEGGAR